jgi:acetyl esterase/lipase
MIKAVLSFLAGAAVVAVFFIVQPYLRETPPSELASEASVTARAAMMERLGPHMAALVTGDIDARRQILDEHFYGPNIKQARERYAVTEEVLEIAGVYTEVFEPAEGVPERNAGRVLINLHGGGFSVGARTEGRLESIPVAAVARMRVISVDYRQGPEHRFPAGSEDVAAVYSQLLQDYDPSQIGIFGCSAGGLLTAQVVAWFDAHDLPQPGAVGMFCSGAGFFRVGDSSLISEILGSQIGVGDMAYFEGASWDDPLVAPINHPDVLSIFPPSLIINSTRDITLSSAIATHQRLIGAGADSELHVYEGLMHGFFFDTSLPESGQVNDVIARFFDANLAR